MRVVGRHTRVEAHTQLTRRRKKVEKVIADWVIRRQTEDKTERSKKKYFQQMKRKEKREH